MDRIQNYILILVISMTACIGDVSAQNNMLIEQLSNKLVVRENYNADKTLISKQTFRVGDIKEVDSYYEVEVITELYDEKGGSIDKYNTTYRCKPDESSIMVMIFPFSNPKSIKSKISTTSKNFKTMYQLEKLYDVDLEIHFESGILNFVGSKSKVSIYNRKLLSSDKTIILQSQLDVKVYALGIRLKQLKYKVNEKLTVDGILYYQLFLKNDGSYFTMTYN